MQMSEVVRLVLALIVLPALFTFYRRLRPAPGMREIFLAGMAIFASYVFTIFDSAFYADFFNMLQHVMYALAGVLAFVGAVKLRSFVLEDGGR
jgi:hypothetical protein